MLPQTLQIPSTKTLISSAASAAATAMLIRSILRDFIPRDLQHQIFSKLQNLFASFSSDLTLIIEEFDGMNHNQLFKSAEIYLQPSISPQTKRFRVTLPKKENKISISMERNDEIIDTFDGIQLKWKSISQQIPSKYIMNPGSSHYEPLKSEVRCFKLSFHKKHKEMVMDTYLPHVLERSKQLMEEKKTLKLFTLKYDRMHGRRGEPWESVNLDHPATFDTLAMDSDLKTKIIDDLQMFVKRKEFYRKVGKAWKRGYLLFGPPGTGKSSLIAAMANYLNFDIYDLELTDLRGNHELRKLLISTGNRSILVVEDIDCSIELQDRLVVQARIMHHPNHNPGSQVTLSGLLNFIDGLWSSCGDERIIVFTTNHKNKLDPALLRPGRMDVHVFMSYCTPDGFKLLASNYLGITEHPLLLEIEEMIEMIKVTPADIGEQLMKEDVPEMALRGLIEFLEKKRESDETKDVEAELGAVVVTEDMQGLEDGGNRKSQETQVI